MDLLALQTMYTLSCSREKVLLFLGDRCHPGTQTQDPRTPKHWSFFEMDVLLSSYLTMDIDSDKESHFTHHGAMRNPTLLTMDFRNG